MAVNDITLTSLESITAFDTSTGAYRFTLDELQNATIANGQERTDITGKNGRRISSLKKNKTVTISGTNGLLSGGLLELQTGGKFVNGESTILWTDYVAKVDSTFHTTYTAVGTAGTEIIALYAKNADGTLGQKYEQVTEEPVDEDDKFYYDAETRLISFLTDPDTDLVVFYNRNIEANVIKNDADKFSGKASLYIDAIGEDKCDNVYRVQIYVPRADFNGEFSIEMGGDQVVHAFEAESLSGACGMGSDLWTYTVFGADAADA